MKEKDKSILDDVAQPKESVNDPFLADEEDGEEDEIRAKRLQQETEQEESDFLDSDSSNENDDVFVNDAENIDIVAGSPMPRVTPPPQEEQKVEQEGRQEMGGIIVYDSYAKLTGCEKIVKYFDEKKDEKIDPYKLFSHQETKDVIKEIFSEKVRERDFACDNDKMLFRNLPRFQNQRDFSNPQFEIFVPQQQNILIFDSRFENGNLRKAAKVNNVEYNLWLENDLNTKGHTQWYYFKVVYRDIELHRDRKVHRIKFNILNLAKTTSLYQVGMKPCIWSKKKYETEGIGWFRGADEITYQANEIPREKNDDNQRRDNNNTAFLQNYNGYGEGIDNYYTLSFKYEFAPNEDDEVWFAHAIPSTYSQMQDKLVELRNDERYKSYLKMNILCQTLARIPAPILTVTENVESYLDYYEEIKILNTFPSIIKKQYRQIYINAKNLQKQGDQSKGRVQKLLSAAIEEQIKQFYEANEEELLKASPSFAGFGQRLCRYIQDHGCKKAIFITSRVHPGEPQASHMLDGLIKLLLSDEAAEIRKHFVIRIVPMLNPDGVIYGNYRCSLLGCDLNRKWLQPNRLLHPTIFYSKLLIRQMHQERKIILYCDLHGHSRKPNAFFYGCCYKNYEQEGRIKNAQLRLIPLMCCQKNELFSIKECRFKIERCKEQTGRVVIFREFNIMNSFTLECSFFGKQITTKDKRRYEHMSEQDYNSLGQTLIQIMHNYTPSESYKLQFLSGKILDVFYDEFIKFIPPYILKREEEKRKKLEEEQQPKKRQSGISGNAAINLTSRLEGQVQNQKQQPKSRMTRKTTYNFSYNGQIQPLGSQLKSLNKDAHATLTNVANTELELVIQDQDEDKGITSGTETENLSVANMPPNPDIQEFEQFMQGLQQKLKDRQQRRQNREDGAELTPSDSEASSSFDGNFKKKRKRKKLKKKIQAKEIAKKVSEIKKNPQTALKSQKTQGNNMFQAQAPPPRPKVPQLPKNYRVSEKKYSIPNVGLVSSQQINQMIESEISQGNIDQAALLSEISRNLGANNQLIREDSQITERHNSQQQQMPKNGQKTLANAIYENALQHIIKPLSPRQKRNHNMRTNVPMTNHAIQGHFSDTNTAQGYESMNAETHEQLLQIYSMYSPIFNQIIRQNGHKVMKGKTMKENSGQSPKYTQYNMKLEVGEEQVRRLQASKDKEIMQVSLSQQNILELQNYHKQEPIVGDYKKNLKRSALLQSITSPKHMKQNIKPVLGQRTGFEQKHTVKDSFIPIINTIGPQNPVSLHDTKTSSREAPPNPIDNVKQFDRHNLYYNYRTGNNNNNQGRDNMQQTQHHYIQIQGTSKMQQYKSPQQEKSAEFTFKSEQLNRNAFKRASVGPLPNSNNNKFQEITPKKKSIAYFSREEKSVEKIHRANIIDKQKQLQQQLERQQKLLQQLQTQLHHQNKHVKEDSRTDVGQHQIDHKLEKFKLRQMVANEIVSSGHDSYYKYNNEEKKHGSQGYLRSDDFLYQTTKNSDPVKTPDNVMQRGKINFQELPKSPEQQQKFFSKRGQNHPSYQSTYVPNQPPQGLSVANFVQNINVFVSEPNQSLRVSKVGGFGLQLAGLGAQINKDAAVRRQQHIYSEETQKIYNGNSVKDSFQNPYNQAQFGSHTHIDGQHSEQRIPQMRNVTQGQQIQVRAKSGLQLHPIKNPRATNNSPDHRNLRSLSSCGGSQNNDHSSPSLKPQFN